MDSMGRSSFPMRIAATPLAGADAVAEQLRFQTHPIIREQAPQRMVYALVVRDRHRFPGSR